MLSSKTVQLGVIVLAFELLGKWKFRAPRILRAVARALGVSRKSGYEAAERIRRRLEDQGHGREHEDLERENALLRIQTQVLGYERDHNGVRFRERGKHLPREARSLSVRLLRDFRERLTTEEIAGAIGVSPASLRRWEKEADEHCRFPEKTDGRGKRRHHREEDEKEVLEAWAKLEEPATIAEFARRYKSGHPDRPLDPKTILKILRKHGLRPLGAEKRSGPYRDKVEIYFPGAQAALDATETKVRFVGGEQDETLKLKEEVAIDLASGAILGTALRTEEDSEGVERVVVRAREECEKILAVLSDNGSANTSSEVKRVMNEETELGSIFSFPRHPQTNGHIEGLFGQFKRIVGTIQIDDSSRESMARSVVALIWRIYVHFHNYSPRRRLGGLSPIEHLRRYAPVPEEVEAARRELRKRKKRSEDLRRPNPRLIDDGFRELLKRVIREHRFEVDLERALRSLVHYDTQVIESSSRAFFVSSKRDGFDEKKRTFAYFVGIVRNKQKELDEARLRERFERDRTQSELERRRRHERELKRERAEEAQDLRERPERVILDAAKVLLSGGLRLMVNTFLGKLREGLDALEHLGRNTKPEIARLALEIRSWGGYREELKAQMVETLEREARGARERVSANGPSQGAASTERLTARTHR